MLLTCVFDAPTFSPHSVSSLKKQLIAAQDRVAELEAELHAHQHAARLAEEQFVEENQTLRRHLAARASEIHKLRAQLQATKDVVKRRVPELEATAGQLAAQYGVSPPPPLPPFQVPSGGSSSPSARRHASDSRAKGVGATSEYKRMPSSSPSRTKVKETKARARVRPHAHVRSGSTGTGTGTGTGSSRTATTHAVASATHRHVHHHHQHRAHSEYMLRSSAREPRDARRSPARKVPAAFSAQPQASPAVGRLM